MVLVLVVMVVLVLVMVLFSVGVGVGVGVGDDGGIDVGGGVLVVVVVCCRCSCWCGCRYWHDWYFTAVSSNEFMVEGLFCTISVGPPLSQAEQARNILQGKIIKWKKKKKKKTNKQRRKKNAKRTKQKKVQTRKSPKQKTHTVNENPNENTHTDEKKAFLCVCLWWQVRAPGAPQPASRDRLRAAVPMGARPLPDSRGGDAGSGRHPPGDGREGGRKEGRTDEERDREEWGAGGGRWGAGRVYY